MSVYIREALWPRTVHAPSLGIVLHLDHGERVAQTATWQGEESQGKSLLVQQQGTKKVLHKK